jgi:hypothetical protein
MAKRGVFHSDQQWAGANFPQGDQKLIFPFSAGEFRVDAGFRVFTFENGFYERSFLVIKPKTFV